MTNLDSILKSRDITLSTKFCIVKAMFFPSSYVCGVPYCSAGKESTCIAGKISGEGKGFPLQYSGLENSMDYRDHKMSDMTERLSLSRMAVKVGP